MSKRIALGIDLGTTYCCSCVYQNGKVEVIPNEQGNRTTPSWVSFLKNERLVGDAAKNERLNNDKNTVYDVKRLIGKRFNEIDVKKDNILYDLKEINERVVIQVNYENEIKTYSPEEISSFLLAKIKNDAEKFLNTEIQDAVITVPAYFNDSQRQATKDAALIAGLNVLRIINEPTSAALCYGLDKKSDKEMNVIVFDFGGGTHDVSLLSIDNGVFEVLATSGNTHLGGRDIDNVIVEYCIEYAKKQMNLDLKNNTKAKNRLLCAAEKAKLILSSALTTSIEIDSIDNGVDFNLTLTRAKFDEICKNIFIKTLEPIDKVLIDSGKSKSQIDEIILVGGSSRIPYVQTKLSDYFNGKVLCNSVNPDEAVAYGACVQAKILLDGLLKKENPDYQNNDNNIGDLLLIDITPLTLGIETNGQYMSPVINRNTTIPIKKSEVFSTDSDNQTTVTIRIFEGERKFTKDNNLLGTFNLENIPPMKRGQPQIEISLDVDANGILIVTAVEKSTGVSKNITIENNKGRLSKEEIEKMINDAEKFKDEDEKKKNILNASADLKNYCFDVKHVVESVLKDTEDDNKNKVSEKLNEILSWNNDSHDLNEYNEKQKELDSLYKPLCDKYKDIISTSTNSSNPDKNNDFNFEELMKNINPEQKQQFEELMKNQDFMKNMMNPNNDNLNTDNLNVEHNNDNLNVEHNTDNLNVEHNTNNLNVEHNTNNLNVEHNTDNLNVEHNTDNLNVEHNTDNLNVEHNTNNLNVDFNANQKQSIVDEID
jgi:heat shock protein 1/8